MNLLSTKDAKIAMSKQIILKFPVELPKKIMLDNEILNKGKEAIVLELFKKGKISSGYAADLLSLCLADFMELLKRKNIPFTSYTSEDWEQDKKAVKKMMKAKK